MGLRNMALVKRSIGANNNGGARFPEAASVERSENRGPTFAPPANTRVII